MKYHCAFGGEDENRVGEEEEVGRRRRRREEEVGGKEVGRWGGR